MKKQIKYLLITLLSIFISYSFYFGNLLYNKNYSNIINISNLIKGLLLVPLVFIILNILIKLIECITIKDSNNKILKDYPLIVIMILLLIAWLPALISNYPGIIEADYVNQYNQAMGIISFNTQHPLLHTYLIVLSSKFVGTNPTHIVLMNSILQMIIMSFIFAYIIKYFYKKNKIISFILFIICISYQLIPLYSVYLTKDVLFSGFLILFSLLIYELLVEKENFTNKKIIILVITTILVSLLRSNGIFIVLGTLFVIILFNRKVKILYILFFISIVSFIAQYSFISINHIEKNDIAEAIGIPINQVSCLVYKDVDLTDEELSLINEVLDLNEIKNSFNKYYSDPIKFNPNFSSLPITNNKLGYVKLYYKLLIKYPKYFIETRLNMTIGYWYPFINKGSISYNYEDRSLYYDSICVNMPKKDTYKKYITSEVRDNLIGSILYSPGFACLLMITLIVISFILKRKTIYVLLPSFIGWLTILLATPSYSETRYVYYVFLINIICIALLFSVNSVKNVKKM